MMLMVIQILLPWWVSSGLFLGGEGSSGISGVLLMRAVMDRWPVLAHGKLGTVTPSGHRV